MSKLTPEMEAINEIQRLIKEADELVAESVKALREEKAVAMAEKMIEGDDPVRAIDVVRDLMDWRNDMKEAVDVVIVKMLFELTSKELREQEQ